MGKIRMLVISSLCIAALAGQVALAGPRAREARRNSRQNARIEKGEANGQLTSKEEKRLTKEQRKIRRDEKRARADGVITPVEARKINREQNRASRDIYRLKHNNRTAAAPGASSNGHSNGSGNSAGAGNAPAAPAGGNGAN